mmetsp:Transcript_14883/g.25244  ORF Transcript_14883/g.25244 Transcript_14883/m.25244 type:complete len:268 (+) Transcript_14883:59-862(+)
MSLAQFGSMPLSVLENDARIFCQQMQDFKIETMLIVAIPVWQVALNLLGEATDEPWILTGEAMDLDEFEAGLASGTHIIARQSLISLRVDVASQFERFDLLEELYKPYVKGRDQAFRGHSANFGISFMEGLVSYKLYRFTGKRKYRKQARRATKRVQGWRKDGVPDCIPVALCLEAEEMVLRDQRQKCRKVEVLRLYNDAIGHAKEFGIWKWEAIFNERAFHVALQVYKDQSTAEPYLQEALQCLERWEAYAKVEWLENRYGMYLSR